MASAQFTALANNDLKEIRDYIALDKPKVASNYLVKLKQKFDLLANSPALGTQRDEYYGLYKFPVDDYLIFYRPSKTGVEIIRILHGNRDIITILNLDE